ncbi:MAG: dihydrolipoamide acetyltransferase family protein [Ktedonobacterales bacterium]
MSQFLLPDLGEGLEEAQLVQWLVQPGDTVTLNQPICQVETAKAMVDIPSPFAGAVQALHAKPGDTVPVGAPLLTIAETSAPANGAATSATATSAQAEGASGAVLVGYGTGGPAQPFARRRRLDARGRGEGSETTENTERTEGRGEVGDRRSGSDASSWPPRTLPRTSALPPMKPMAPTPASPSASPLVRKMAAERGVDLATIAGTGPGGRIRVEDLEAALTTHATSTTAAPLAAHGEEPGVRFSEDEERISTVGLRKAIAARMVRAATTIPHFTEYSQFDASALVALRERLKADPAYAGTKLTYLPFFVRALVRAVQAYPILNSRWDEEGNAIIVKKSVHAGIATDTPRGLLVPVVRNAHTLSLPEIAAECGRLVALAREGKLDAKSLSGSTITITNVGAAGPVDTGAPLINPPEACVVGFGAIKPRPTVVGDALAVRPGCWISISCDHRIVDGAAAAQFMGVLVEALEHPESLVG